MKEEGDGLNQVQVSIQRKAAILAVDTKHIEIQIYKVLNIWRGRGILTRARKLTKLRLLL